MILPKHATVAVADGEKLRLFRNTGDAINPSLTAVDHPAIDGGNGGSGGRHHSSSANPDDSRQQEDGYAAGSAAWLNRQVLEKTIEALVIIASPKTLGELRRHYHKALQAVLLGEIGKDLTGRPVGEIAAAVAAA
ncbi:MAG TPA: host attachment protein [Caulobacteraceae bacterium]|jgi:protein required for attachment to host cells|nr:host attachment protein [Caulobacteraceae bacterium]